MYLGNNSYNLKSAPNAVPVPASELETVLAPERNRKKNNNQKI